jgi:hypothetical protein
MHPTIRIGRSPASAAVIGFDGANDHRSFQKLCRPSLVFRQRFVLPSVTPVPPAKLLAPAGQLALRSFLAIVSRPAIEGRSGVAAFQLSPCRRPRRRDERISLTPIWRIAATMFWPCERTCSNDLSKTRLRMEHFACRLACHKIAVIRDRIFVVG